MSSKALRSITIEHLRGCVAPFTLSFEQGKKLSIIYGENGSGKSTICDAFEFVARGHVGSLDSRGLGQTQKYWPAAGKLKNDIAVELTTRGTTYRASLARSTVVWNPSDDKPKLEILRRAQILKLIETQPSQRYNEISRFINVAGVEKSESALKSLLEATKRDQESQLARLQGSKDALDKLFGSSGAPGDNSVAWARNEAAKDYSQVMKEISDLDELEKAFQRLSRHVGTWRQVDQKIQDASNAVDVAKASLDGLLQNVSADIGNIIEILNAASTYLADHPKPETCPLCESNENITDLTARVNHRLAEFRSLRNAKKNFDAAKQTLALAQSEPNRLIGRFEEDRKHFIGILKSRQWDQAIELPTKECPSNLADFDSWYASNQVLVERWRSVSNTWKEAKSLSISVKNALAAYEDNLAIPTDTESLIPRLEQALDLLRKERHAFTENILSTIADEVGRLYEVVHPGEGFNKISLELDPKKRSSLNLGADFRGTTGSPPQAYFSESHLDTLGLCVFLALAKMEQPDETILVLDDVLASIDEPHVERVIELIYEEAKNFQHCVVTTHYRPWKEKYRWGWLKNGQCQFIELSKWSEQDGLSQTRSIPEVTRLETIMNEPSPDLQAVCGKAGVILEALLDFLTLHYQCKVPRRPNGKYTLGELLPSIKKKLRSSLRVDVLTVKDDGSSSYEEHPLGCILDELEKIAQIRNVVGAHFNALSYELLDTDAMKFSKKVFELSQLLIDENVGWPKNGKSGSYWATVGETRRLHPYAEPT